MANPTVSTVTEYPLNTFGNVPPSLTNPNLQSPGGIARDTAGNLYVVNSGDNAITEYAWAASGAANPVATICGCASHVAE